MPTHDSDHGAGPTTVVYVMGSGRSGSTLLERILGEIPGFVTAGELIGLFRWIAVDDELCGCGTRFSQCPYWQAVGRRAFGGWDDARVAEIAALQRRVARQRHLPRLAAPALAGASFRADLASYGEVYGRLYRAIRDEAGARAVVDASKWPAQVLALRDDPGIDLRVIHLVRDVRGVAYSWSKTGVVRPQSTSEALPELSSVPVSRTAAAWTAVQAEAAWLTATSAHAVAVRYEDLVVEPRATLVTALTRLGFPADVAADLPHVSGRTVTLGPGHGVGGNPSRFTTGEVTLRLDDAWHDRLDRRDRWLSTAIGLPALARHRYLGAAPRPR